MLSFQRKKFPDVKNSKIKDGKSQGLAVFMVWRSANKRVKLIRVDV